MQDIAILNFFFDTPIITEITLELRTSIFDQISAIGGTLGLFTGISVITLVEVIYWISKFLMVSFGILKSTALTKIKGTSTTDDNVYDYKCPENGRNSVVKSSFL